MPLLSKHQKDSVTVTPWKKMITGTAIQKKNKIWREILAMGASSIYVIIFFLFILPDHYCNAKSKSLDVHKKSYDFAKYLFKKGEYYRAITEYERFIFYFPRDSLVARAKLQIGVCFRKGEQWEKAIWVFREVAKDYAEAQEGQIALFEVGETHFLNGDYNSALGAFIEFLKQYPESSLSNMARYRTGWSYLYEGKPEAASKQFIKISVEGDENFAQALSNAALQYKNIPKKDPKIAGFLSSIMPGAGQLYAERQRDALVSFLLNGAFIMGSIEAINHGSYIVGGILLFFESVWYTGNVYNAVNDVHKYNTKRTDCFFKDLRDSHPEERLSNFSNSTIFLGFTFDF